MMTHALAQERLPSQPLAVQHEASSTILALDLGTTTGWALRTPEGLITSGTVSFRPSRYDGGGMRYLRFTNWLTEIDQLSGPIAAIWYEEVRRHIGTDAAHVYSPPEIIRPASVQEPKPDRRRRSWQNASVAR